MLKRTFTFERATKNTYRFSEDLGQGPVAVGVIYVQKDAFAEQPAKITVSIEEVV